MRRAKRSRRWKNIGLFPRLVAAFVLVGVGSVAAAGGAVYLSAWDGIMRTAQDRFLHEFDQNSDWFSDNLDQLYANDPGTLEFAPVRAGGPVRIEFVDGSYNGGNLPSSSVPQALRDVVDISEGVHFHRVQEGLHSVFYVGRRFPAVETSRGTVEGLQIFVAYSLDGANAEAMALAKTTLGASLVVVVLAAAAGTFIAARLVRPLHRVTKVVGEMRDGSSHQPIPVSGWGEIAALTRSLNDTSQQLDQSMTDLRESEAGARRFVADVSHELRTPVAALVALTEVLPVGPGQLSEPQARAVYITKNEVIKLARLVDDLIEISRFDAGRAHARTTVESLAELTAQSIASRGWDVELDLDETIETATDARRWDLIVANLVSNAFRHGNPPVKVSLAADGTGIILTVTNHGDPIPAGALPHVFERFYKAEHARTRSEGSGLGLAITAENVKLLGGTIKVESDAAATRFTVTMPYDDVSEVPDEPDTAAVSGHGWIEATR